MIQEGFERSPELVQQLAKVWERSVRATHAFLTEDDIVAIRPHVLAALATDERLALAGEAERPVGFASARRGKLNMLFVDPDARGRGFGRALLSYAVKQWDVYRLDVNEQNPDALGFYQHEGFDVVARSSVDGGGRPFPLLHLMARQGIRADMASGVWFEAADEALERDRVYARQVMMRFNTDFRLTPEERVGLLRELFGALGPGTDVSAGAQVDYGYSIFVGRNCFFNFNCIFLDGAPITFGDDVWVGPGCTFATPLHPLLARERAVREDADGTMHVWERNLPITVEDGVWIAANVTVHPGVTIGEGAVIGAGSVVTKDIPPHTVAFGNPCCVQCTLTEHDSLAATPGEVFD